MRPVKIYQSVHFSTNISNLFIPSIMKKYLLFILGLMLLCNVVKAQYTVNKTKYDYRTYEYEVGDPYNPGVAGITSVLIPGLGQAISGEAARGLGFLGGYAGCWVIFGMGWGEFETSFYSKGGELALTGILGIIIVDLWSAIDAFRVAKVNNLAWRDKHRTAIKINVQPYVNHFQTRDKHYTQTGLTVQFNFW